MNTNGVRTTGISGWVTAGATRFNVPHTMLEGGGGRGYQDVYYGSFIAPMPPPPFVDKTVFN